MAHDEDLADRLRVALGRREDGPVTEKKMFGGHAFLVGGHMAVAASGQGGLMVRCEPAETQELRQRPGAGPMVMRGKELDGWLRVEESAVTSDEALEEWVAVGAAYTSSLPPK